MMWSPLITHSQRTDITVTTPTGPASGQPGMRQISPEPYVRHNDTLSSPTQGPMGTSAVAATAQLAHDLGIWLAVLALLAAVTVASLLTVAAVTRRVREFGTLKALG